MKKKILISTGGSGGHVILATTLYDHLKFNYEILITTDDRGFKYVDKENYQVNVINTPKLNKLILFPFAIIKILLLTIKSLIILKRENISILISTGGYMSLPLCLAAKLLNIKIFLIEPNMVLGRANKFFLNFSKKILCYSKNLINLPKNFEKKITIIKPLIRKKYYNTDIYRKKDSLFTIIIIGGSQGAKIFDKLINETLKNISKKISLKIIHQTSEKNIDLIKNFYTENKIENKVFAFDKDLNELLQQSDLCITRAGASSLAELSYFNIPFIAIPLPTSKDNHQYENAKYYKDKDCCWIIEQASFNKVKFEELLLDITNKKDNYLKKKNNLQNLNYQNTWNNVNQNLLKIFNEN
ncbi:MAG: UDP-N-acetylglucosamine--N-acetylmuramyl-(pentapeptide) pyrophosphoryl-undecaprenol N-acetylglucosamine transferase [Candidatus Pelagibacter sp. TMED239]|nr:MAG: UDP-N-acetylglucosamine--N-acetylmuramyl-(pentapeptide) pyrophosphoryl-undecaprenol N-acetylglucosamine transferase [Candidatus Pelagibacter sp. TMED239]